MIVDVLFVDMGTDDKGMIALGEAFGELISKLISFLRRNLSRLERLANLIRNHIAFLYAPGELAVLPF